MNSISISSGLSLDSLSTDGLEQDCQATSQWCYRNGWSITPYLPGNQQQVCPWWTTGFVGSILVHFSRNQVRHNRWIAVCFPQMTDRRASRVFLRKIGNGLVSRGRSLTQPHHFNITAGDLFQTAGTANLVLIAIDTQFQQNRRVKWRLTRTRPCTGMLKSQRVQLKRLNQRINRPDRIVRGDIIVHTRGSQLNRWAGRSSWYRRIDIVHPQWKTIIDCSPPVNQCWFTKSRDKRSVLKKSENKRNGTKDEDKRDCQDWD